MMIEKFSSQRLNRKNLESEVSKAEKRLSEAKKEYSKQESLFQELKASGMGGTELNREIVIQKENEITVFQYQDCFCFSSAFNHQLSSFK
jgi:hypothetical protein